MANEYVSLATLKLNLKITVADRDVLLNQALAGASRGIDRVCGRRFYQDASATARTYPTRGRVTCDGDGELFIVDDVSTLADLVVETGDGTTWTVVTDFFTEPANALAEGRAITGLRRNLGYWSTSRRMRVTARWGWPAIPDEIVQATLIQASRLYIRKDSLEGVAGNSEWGAVRVARIDPDVRANIEHLALAGF